MKALLLIYLIFFSTNLQAHRLGESYIFLTITENAPLKGRIEVTLKDLSKVIVLDKDGNGDISESELQREAAEIKAYFSHRLHFYDQARQYKPEFNEHALRKLKFATFVMLDFNVPDLFPIPESLDVDYSFLFNDLEPSHRGLLVLENNTRSGAVSMESNVALIFTADETRQALSLKSRSWFAAFSAFVKQGIWHIWIGIDHILFIITLLLPSVLIYRQRKWQPVNNLKESILYVFKIISLFTLAHSLTLSLAALEIVKLPPNLVEAVIAISIGIAALNNIFPLFRQRIGLLVVGFGLFHGFGFANVLLPLGLSQSSLLSSLVGFNLGVELGQLVIVGLVFPLLYLSRNWKPYRLQILNLASVGLIAVSFVWFVERAFLA